MNLTNEQKQWIAKQLPKEIQWCGCSDKCRAFFWMGRGLDVRETEWLHLISLVEARLSDDQWIQYTYALLDRNGFKTRTMVSAGVYGGVALLKATAPQRCTALMEVLK